MTRRPGTTRRGLSIMARGARQEWRLFTVSVVGSLVYGALTVADAWVLGWATDEVISPAFDAQALDQSDLWAVSLLFLGVALARALGIIGRRLVGGLVYFRLMATDRRRVTRQYLRLPMRWHQQHPTGQLLSNANADVEATWMVMMPLPMAVGVIAMLLVAVVAMIAADLVLTVVGLVIFPLLFAVNVGYQKVLSPRVTLSQQLRADVSEVAHESFDGATVVKALGREGDETRRFATVTHRLQDANIAAGRVRSVFDPVLEALPIVGVLLVVVIGVQRVLAGAAAPGDVVEVAFLFTVIAFPVRAIGWVLGELPRSVVGWDRVRAVLDATGETSYGAATVAGDGPVRLDVRSLRFGYVPDRPVLAGLDFTVRPGRTVALVGRTGSGKSTLTSLLVRLMDPDSGAVCLDGTDVRDLTHEGLAAAAALVPQHTFLFDDTVRGNVSLGDEVPDEQVWQALRTAQADDFVARLPLGLDQEIGERGTTLSGGQRQRLALARALVRRPRLLVLDDATSAVDPEVERAVLEGLRRESAAGGPTTLVVAYRKATIALADEVLFLEGGRIVDRGTHAELAARSAAYRDIVDAYDQARARTEAAAGAPSADDVPVGAGGQA
ncbi:MAG TPA: ABC transporter ATP-binding protein [Nocardioidaceae bacterium]|nr:ABC transporter ATP-binding protein [Nocardioidaceae bacterium]